MESAAADAAMNFRFAHNRRGNNGGVTDKIQTALIRAAIANAVTHDDTDDKTPHAVEKTPHGIQRMHSLGKTGTLLRRAFTFMGRQTDPELGVEFKNMFEGHYVAEPFEDKLYKLLLQHDVHTHFKVQPKSTWLCSCIGVPSALTFFTMPCCLEKHRKLFWRLQPIAQPFEKMNMVYFGILPLYYLLFSSALLPIMFNVPPASLPWLWVVGTALLSICVPLILVGTPIIIATALAFNHVPRTHTRQFFRHHTHFLSSLFYVGGTTMWWSLVGVTLRLIAVNQYPDATTATGTSSPDCALALAAIIAASASSSSNLIGANMTVLSRLTNQLLECSNGKSEGDPYAMHKNATMSAAWVLGMVLTTYWSVEARRLWETHYGNSHQVEKLLREMAEYPNARHANRPSLHRQPPGPSLRRQPSGKNSVVPLIEKRRTIKSRSENREPIKTISETREPIKSRTETREPIKSRGSEGVCAGVPETVQGLLQRLNLTSFLPAITDMGGETMVHLNTIQDEDLKSMGMKPLQRRALLQAVAQANPHTTTTPNANTTSTPSTTTTTPNPNTNTTPKSYTVDKVVELKPQS